MQSWLVPRVVTGLTVTQNQRLAVNRVKVKVASALAFRVFHVFSVGITYDNKRAGAAVNAADRR